MNTEHQTRILGKTGLTVGRLGVAASYGAPAKAFEEAFEKGCNYFVYGSGRRRSGMMQAIKNICNKGHRDKLVIAFHHYARIGLLSENIIQNKLRSLGIDSFDILILGWHNRRPFNMLVNRAMMLKEKGIIKFIGMSGHNRKLFPTLTKLNVFDVFHIRYNAAHRGAEMEVFPFLNGLDKPGIVTYTATRWKHLINPKKMPKEQPPLSASDCYRFVLSNTDVDICLTGPSDVHQMREALTALDKGPLDSDEMKRIQFIGDYVHKKSKGPFF